MTTIWFSKGQQTEHVTERLPNETDKDLRARHFADVAVSMDLLPPDHDHSIVTTWS